MNAPDDIEIRYGHGWCHALCAALLQLVPGEPFVLASDDGAIAHSAVRLPHTETLVDALGIYEGRAGWERAKAHFADGGALYWIPATEAQIAALLGLDVKGQIRRARPVARLVLRRAESAGLASER